MEKKLSEQLQDAYMVGDKELIIKLLGQLSEKAEKFQKKTTISPLTVNTVLNNENASVIKIYDFLNEIFGEDWWELEFETIERLLWVKYGTALEDINRDKIWSIKYLCNSQRPFLDWWLFNQIAISFGGAIADFEMLRSPTPGMIINAINTMKYIRPEEPFSREVKKYISILLITEGIYVPPPSLTDIITEEFSILLSNFNKDDWVKIYNKYKEILETKKFDLEENHIDIQVKRILIAEESALEYAK